MAVCMHAVCMYVGVAAHSVPSDALPVGREVNVTQGGERAAQEDEEEVACVPAPHRMHMM